jgi:hypothetical protein
MAGDPAELAFGHALAMLGDPEAAIDVASTALRRAGRARGLVLAHARQQSVARAAADEPVDIAQVQTVVLDLPALAATLASTRPPEERAALDVRARTGGDLAALGDGLGMRPSAAADKCSEIADTWERTLDPALLAFSGAGECDTLATMLRDVDPQTVADLLDLAPAVHAHVPDCTLCTDRMRAMASVRSFFSGGHPAVPDEVREVGHVSRRRRSSATPPPLFAGSATKTRARRRVARAPWAIGALAGALAVTGGVFALRDDGNDAVSDLTRIAAGKNLTLAAAELDGDVARVRLRNPTDRAVSYRAATSSEWAGVSPKTGRIRAHDTLLLVVRALDAAPEGETHTTLTVTTSSGGAMTTDIVWSLEHPPDIDATAQGCAVDVHVVEEGELSSLVLHWRDAAEHTFDITTGPDGYHAELKPEGQDVTYWVTAVDGRGNQSRTADQVIPVGAC